jgi:hypothetical protein
LGKVGSIFLENVEKSLVQHFRKNVDSKNIGEKILIQYQLDHQPNSGPTTARKAYPDGKP